ncbi:MAG: flagellin FliC [Nitrospinae bacterium]|nr:flagellin FliC [Nitrospinota bacterium]
MAIRPLTTGFLSTLNATRNLGASQARLGESLNKLASGLQINKAADNAAGLAIAEQLRADIESAGQAQRNISDGTSLTRVAEGGLNEISDLLSRGRELSVQAANGTLNDQQRATINTEINAIQSEIDRITNVTEFNGQQLLSGDLAPGAPTQLSIQAGIQNTPNDRVSLNVIEATNTQTLGVDTVNISTQAGAQDAIGRFDTAIAQVADRRASIGALQNRLESAANNLAVTRENLTSAENNIRGLDYAKETGEFARNQIMSQAAAQTLRAGLGAESGLIGALLNIRG